MPSASLDCQGLLVKVSLCNNPKHFFEIGRAKYKKMQENQLLSAQPVSPFSPNFSDPLPFFSPDTPPNPVQFLHGTIPFPCHPAGLQEGGKNGWQPCATAHFPTSLWESWNPGGWVGAGFLFLGVLLKIPRRTENPMKNSKIMNSHQKNPQGSC